MEDLLGGGGGGGSGGRAAATSPAAAPAAADDLFGGGGSAPPPPPAAAPTHRSQPITELDDLFGAPASARDVPAAPAFPPITAWEKDGLRVGFEFSKPPGNPQATEIVATYTNSGSETASDFTLQVRGCVMCLGARQLLGMLCLWP